MVFRWFVGEILWFVRVILTSMDRFYSANGLSRAASLAYTTLLSLVPFTALIFGILTSFAVSDLHIEQVREFIFKQFVPNTDAVDTILLYLQEFSGVISTLNVLVIGFLVITSIFLLNSIESAFNEIWQVFKSRTLSQRISIFCAILVIGPVLAVSAFYFARFRLDPYISDTALAAQAAWLYQLLLPFLVDFLAFSGLYFLIPKAPVKLRSAFFGAFLAAILFGLAKAGFAAYFEQFTSYNRVYGAAIAAIPFFLVWLYLAWIIVLFGAECSFQVQHMSKSGRVFRRSILSMGEGRVLLALEVLIIIVKAFNEGRPLPREIEISEKLGCSSVVLKPVLDALEKAHLINRMNSVDAPLSLARSPELITVDDIRSALVGSGKSLKFPAEVARFFSSFSGDSELLNRSLEEVVSAPAESTS